MSSKNRPKITQKDVAIAAQVSQTLVSFVFSGGDAREQVSPENQKKILEAAQRLGYRIRSKPAQRSPKNLLAFVYSPMQRSDAYPAWVYDSYEEYYSRFHSQLRIAAQEEGYLLVIQADTDSVALMDWFIELNVQGAFTNSKDSILMEWLNDRLPVIQIANRNSLNCDCVQTDHAAAVELAVADFLQKGHRRIGYCVGGQTEKHVARQRLSRYRELIDFHRLENFEIWDEAPLESWGKQWLNEAPSDPEKYPTAIICPNLWALLLQRQLVENGARLPEQLSIIAIDNTSACELSFPRISSIDNQHEILAKEAVRAMISRLEDPKKPVTNTLIMPTLITRDSVHNLAPTSVKNETSQYLN